ncbi:hypothetical protein PHET_05181 [Paragonimus heterotremus]|uniref:Helicase C-terminal domain-containing protein n=1 Tax=Paragonimus heterotremus TaxID=100268 RepID=A0A8J4SPK5_9TREM|nr:hypothetical protein PHET_05181 [Paragonimus heterotremus]
MNRAYESNEFHKASWELELMAKVPNKLFDMNVVLVFTQMTKMLDILEDLDSEKCERIQCANTHQLSQGANRFDALVPSCIVFLSSTDSGDVSISLGSADSVIKNDPDWSSRNEKQVSSHTHRITQASKVTTICLVARCFFHY